MPRERGVFLAESTDKRSIRFHAPAYDDGMTLAVPRIAAATSQIAARIFDGPVFLVDQWRGAPHVASRVRRENDGGTRVRFVTGSARHG